MKRKNFIDLIKGDRVYAVVFDTTHHTRDVHTLVISKLPYEIFIGLLDEEGNPLPGEDVSSNYYLVLNFKENTTGHLVSKDFLIRESKSSEYIDSDFSEISNKNKIYICSDLKAVGEVENLIHEEFFVD